jgi:hypothetical protein
MIRYHLIVSRETIKTEQMFGNDLKYIKMIVS